MINEIEKMFDYRQTVKKYNDKKISKKDWEIILKSIYWSPTSLGFEPYRILIVNKNNKLRNKIFENMWKQKTVLECDKLIFFLTLKKEVFSSKKFIHKRLKRYIDNFEKGDENVKNELLKNKTTSYSKFLKDNSSDDWSMKQAYIALGSSINVAALLGIGSTPFEGIDKSKMEKLFHEQKLLTNKENISFAIAFGYPFDKTSYAHKGSGIRLRDLWSNKFQEI